MKQKKGRAYVRPPCLAMEPARVSLSSHAGPQTGLDPSIGCDTGQAGGLIDRSIKKWIIVARVQSTACFVAHRGVRVLDRLF